MSMLPRLAVLVLLLPAGALAQSKGAIVAVGVVLPQSSAVQGAGDSSVRMWLDAGAKAAGKVDSHVQPAAAGGPVAATGVKTSVLREGMSLSVK